MEHGWRGILESHSRNSIQSSELAHIVENLCWHELIHKLFAAERKLLGLY